MRTTATGLNHPDLPLQNGDVLPANLIAQLEILARHLLFHNQLALLRKASQSPEGDQLGSLLRPSVSDAAAGHMQGLDPDISALHIGQASQVD